MDEYLGRFIELVWSRRQGTRCVNGLLVLGEGSRILTERPGRYREVWFREVWFREVWCREVWYMEVWYREV